MSTQFTERNKEKEETLPQIQAPSQGLPPPPRPKGGRWLVIATVILVLAIILGGSAFVLALVAQHPGGQVTPTRATQCCRILGEGCRHTERRQSC